MIRETEGIELIEDGSGRKFIPVPAPPGIDEWAKLYAKLVRAAEHDRMGIEYEGAPPGFTGAEASLHAILGFLMSNAAIMEQKAAVPLLRLASALRDLHGGSRPRLLAPRMIKVRPPGETPRAHVIGFAARALDRLMKAGASSADGARIVCAALKKGRAFGWRTTRPETVIRWRARCKEGAGADVPPSALKKFAEKITILEPPPAEEAEFLLNILREASLRGLG